MPDPLPAHAEYQNCLACHSPADRAGALANVAASHEGVSCEACHGPAEKWRGKHFQRNWNQKSDPALHGMIDTKNVAARAKLCAECHVGTPERQVNHDLIAAGHPPLKFELTAYQDLMPKHWNDGRVRQANPQFELELWHAGQIATAEAALALLEFRASPKHSQPWPEFAESNCFACHHDLSADGWRPDRAVWGKVVPAWGAWYFPLWAKTTKFGTALANLETTMNARLLPDQNAVSADVPQAIAQLAAESRTPPSPQSLVKRISDLATPAANGEVLVADWDVATQAYLALVALDFAYRDKQAGQPRSSDDKTIADKMQELRAALAFPPGYTSPQSVVGSSGKGGRQKFVNELNALLPLFKKRSDK